MMELINNNRNEIKGNQTNNAEELFFKAGYARYNSPIYKDETNYIEYTILTPFWRDIVQFNLKYKNITFYARDKNGQIVKDKKYSEIQLNLDLLKAINKKCEELGWFNEK